MGNERCFSFPGANALPFGQAWCILNWIGYQENYHAWEGNRMKRYVCTVCGWVYDEAQGLPEEKIAPGTAFGDLPDDFVCPVCGVGKEDFEEE